MSPTVSSAQFCRVWEDINYDIAKILSTTFQFWYRPSLWKLTITIFSSIEISQYEAISLIDSFHICSLRFYYSTLGTVLGAGDKIRQNKSAAVFMNFVISNFLMNIQAPLKKWRFVTPEWLFFLQWKYSRLPMNLVRVITFLVTFTSRYSSSYLF